MSERPGSRPGARCECAITQHQGPSYTAVRAAGARYVSDSRAGTGTGMGMRGAGGILTKSNRIEFESPPAQAAADRPLAKDTALPPRYSKFYGF